MRGLPSPYLRLSPFWPRRDRRPAAFLESQVVVYAGPTDNGDKVYLGLLTAPATTTYVQYRVNGGEVQSAPWIGPGYYLVIVPALAPVIIEIRALNLFETGDWLELDEVTPTRFEELVLTTEDEGPPIELEWNGVPPYRLRSLTSEGAQYLVWYYEDLALPPLFPGPDPEPDPDPDDDGSEELPPITDGVVELTAPQGVYTAPSPAVLNAHRNLFGDDMITVSVSTVTPGQPVTYSYSVTGELILHPTALTNLLVTGLNPPALIDPLRGRVLKGQPNAGTRIPGIVNGAMLNYGEVRAPNGPKPQAFDAYRTSDNNASNNVDYNPALCVDPAYTGESLLFEYGGGGGSITKSVGYTNAELGEKARRVLRSAAIITVTDDLPVADQGSAFRPPTGRTSKAITHYTSDLNRDVFPRLPLPPIMPDIDELIRKLCVWSAQDVTHRPAGDRMSPTAGKAAGYRSDAAQDYTTAGLVLCLDIPDEKHKALAEFIGVIGFDIDEALQKGATWNHNVGLGGILAGSKLPLLLTAMMLGDNAMKARASRTDYSAEDRQIVFVSAADVTGFDYIEEDVDMPEWQMNPVKNKNLKTRLASGYYLTNKTIKAYRAVNTRHQPGQALIGQLVPGMIELWDNLAFFQYADRICSNSFYRTPEQPMNGVRVSVDGVVTGLAYEPRGSTYNWAFGLTGENSPTAFHRSMWETYRISHGHYPLWTWS